MYLGLDSGGILIIIYNYRDYFIGAFTDSGFFFFRIVCGYRLPAFLRSQTKVCARLINGDVGGACDIDSPRMVLVDIINSSSLFFPILNKRGIFSLIELDRRVLSRTVLFIKTRASLILFKMPVLTIST
jgi:hypothetical protein